MANETSTRYFFTVRDAVGNVRTGATVVLSGSAGRRLDTEITLLEDSVRPGMYYNLVPAGTYDLYIDGARDVKLSPIQITAGLERYAADKLFVRDDVGFGAQAGLYIPYFEGAGVGSVDDGDFTVSPLDGAFAVVHNTSNSKTKLFARASGSWTSIYTADTGSHDELAEMEDVNFTSLQDGEVIVYDNGTSKWINTGSAGLAGPDELSELLDVTLTSPQTHHLLAYMGSNWQNQPYSILGLVESGSAETITAAWTFNAGLNTNNDILPVYSYKDSLGSLQKQFLRVNAADLWVESLVAQDTVATIGGRILVGPTTYLTEDLDAASGSIFVEHNQMVQNDTVYMESGGNVEFMRIDSAAGGGGPYEYSVTRNLDGTGANTWYAGAAVFNTRQTSAGFIDIYSIGGIISGSGPTIVGNVRKSNTYYDWGEHWAIGNLDGLYGYTSDTYGVAIGDYKDSSYLTSDSSGGIKIYASGSDQRAQFSVDGSGWLGQNSAITWDAYGNANFSGHLTAATGSIAGWDIFSDELTKNDVHLRAAGYISVGTDNNVAVLGGPSYHDPYRIWAGHETGSSAPFSVQQDGHVHAADIYIEGDVIADMLKAAALTADSATIYGLYLANTGSYGDAEVERIVTAGENLTVFGTGEDTTGSAAIESLIVGDYSVVFGAVPSAESSPATNWDVAEAYTSLTGSGHVISSYAAHAITGSSSNDAYNDLYTIRYRHVLDTSAATLGDVPIVVSVAYLDYYDGTSWTEYGIISSHMTSISEVKARNGVQQVTVPGSNEDIRFRIKTDLDINTESGMAGTVYASVSGSGYTNSTVTWSSLTGGTTLDRRGLAINARVRDSDSRKEPHLWMEPHSAAPANNAGAVGEIIFTSGSADGAQLQLHDGLEWHPFLTSQTYPWRMISPYTPTLATSDDTDAAALSPAVGARKVGTTVASDTQTNIIFRSRLVYDSATQTQLKATIRGYGETDDTSANTLIFRFRLKVGGVQKDMLTATFKSGQGWSGDFDNTEDSLTLEWDITGLSDDGEGYEVSIEAETTTPGGFNGTYANTVGRLEAMMTWVK